MLAVFIRAGVAAAMLAAVAGIPPPAHGAEVPAAVQRVVDRFSADTKGVFALRQRVVYDQRAPGNNDHTEDEYSAVQADRMIVALRWRRAQRGGKDEDAAALAKRQAAADKQFAKPVLSTRFALPMYPEAAADYTFAAPKPCAAPCPAGAQSVEFSSTTRDERHGRGTLVFDADAHVVAIDFVPNVLPKPASSANLHWDYGRQEGGAWAIVRLHEHYAGHMLMISGTADRVTSVEKFRAFPSVDEAKRAVAAGDI